MNHDAITLNERFTPVELFRMFNVDIMPAAPHSEGDRRAYEEGPYLFNDIKCQLWSETKRPLSRGEKNALQSEDHCVVSTNPPGSAGRIADLAAHYQGVEWDTEEGQSAFDIPADGVDGIPEIYCHHCGEVITTECDYCPECDEEL